MDRLPSVRSAHSESKYHLIDSSRGRDPSNADVVVNRTRGEAAMLGNTLLFLFKAALGIAGCVYWANGSTDPIGSGGQWGENCFIRCSGSDYCEKYRYDDQTESVIGRSKDVVLGLSLLFSAAIPLNIKNYKFLCDPRGVSQICARDKERIPLAMQTLKLISYIFCAKAGAQWVEEQYAGNVDHTVKIVHRSVWVDCWNFNGNTTNVMWQGIGRAIVFAHLANIALDIVGGVFIGINQIGKKCCGKDESSGNSRLSRRVSIELATPTAAVTEV